MSDWNWNRRAPSDPPKWIQEVVIALQENGIQFTIIDPILGVFNCQNKAGGRGYRYYASGGVIVGHNLKGLGNLIRLLSINETTKPQEQARPFVEQRSRQNVIPFFREIHNGRPVYDYQLYYPRRETAYVAG